MPDVLGYEGRTVVVTGAASGMGEATAHLLVALGADVIGVDLNPAPAANAGSVAVDLRDRGSIDAALDALHAPLHGIFSCAGLPGPPFTDLDTMLVNFVGARHLVETLVPKMEPGSAIAVIASVGGLGWQDNMEVLGSLLATADFDEAKRWCEEHPEHIAGGYGPSKQALNAWTAWRACTLIDDEIRLNCLNPGPTETPMMPKFEAAQGGGAVIDLFTAPINRRSTALEQAWPLVCLNSPRLSYVNGAHLFADGGFFGGLQCGQIDVAALLAQA